MSALVALLVIALSPRVAHADAVGPSDLVCPRGAGADRHSSVCIPRTRCASEEDCPGYFDTCQDAPALCIELRPDDPERMPSAIVHGECAGGTCSVGACETGRRCQYSAEEEQRYRAQHPEATPTPASGGCCGGGGSDRSAAALLPVGIAALAWRARRRRG